MAKKKDIHRKWYLIDVKDKVLGRISSKIAGILQGKHKPAFSTSLDTGDYVILINAKDIKLTGEKSENKLYFSHSAYPGSGKTINFAQAQKKDPAFPLIHAIRGMLPKTALGRQMIKKLHIYAGSSHPHKAQKPETISI